MGIECVIRIILTMHTEPPEVERFIRIDLLARFTQVVLVPLKISMTDAARLMRVRPGQLSRALRGKQCLTLELCKRMQAVFGARAKAVLPDAVTLSLLRRGQPDAAAGMRRFGPTQPRARSTSYAPAGPAVTATAFGALLRKVIGEERGTLEQVAPLLSFTSKGELSAILNGRRHLTQLLLRRRNLLERLREHFPKGWARDGAELTALAGRLPEKRAKSRVRSFLSR